MFVGLHAYYYIASGIRDGAQAISTHAVQTRRGGREERSQQDRIPPSRSTEPPVSNHSKAVKRKIPVSHKWGGWEEEEMGNPSDERVERVQSSVARHPGVKDGAWTTLDALLVKQAQAEVQSNGQGTLHLP